MTIPSQKVEELAKELWKVYFEGSSWKKIQYPSNQAQKRSFERLSKHVLGLIIQARIDEAKKWYQGDIFPIEKTTGYNELKKQLQSLNPPQGEI